MEVSKPDIYLKLLKDKNYVEAENNYLRGLDTLHDKSFLIEGEWISVGPYKEIDNSDLRKRIKEFLKRIRE